MGFLSYNNTSSGEFPELLMSEGVPRGKKKGYEYEFI